jgi:hypothetical protein
MTTDRTMVVKGYVTDHLTQFPDTQRQLSPTDVKFDINLDFRNLYQREGNICDHPILTYI